jgi:hypothetical protein
VWINDTLFVGEAYTSAYLKEYTFQIKQRVTTIKTVHVHFDNDKMLAMGQDRDLIFRSLTVGGKEIGYNAGNVIYEQRFPDKTKMIPIKTTYAENAAAILLKLGIDGSQIEVIQGPPGYDHKTFNSALSLKKWVVEKKITSFNLLSLGIHARRSRLTYEKALDGEYSIGIIAVPDKSDNERNWWQHRKSFSDIIRETAKYLYIRILPASLLTRIGTN